MSKSFARSVIRLRGVRHNNLKNLDLDLPLNQLIVITGLSGSGKSSLAFDTLFAEGQRRYIETFSPYARQFFDRMDKPRVDTIEGIPPAIAIEQRNAVRTTRSTVGTMTEICDYLRMLWPHIAQLHCRECGRAVRKESPQQVWDEVIADSRTAAGERLITFDVPLAEKLSLEESLALISRQGYQRILINGESVRLEDAHPAAIRGQSAITVVQDRLKPVPANRARFVEACEQAYHFGKGRLTIQAPGAGTRTLKRFSNRLHCAGCDLEYQEPSPALFSFNHPVGACPACKGFGRIISIDYDLAVPDRSKTLGAGVVKPWQTGQGADCQRDLMRTCRHFEIPTNVPFHRLAKKWQDFVIEGDPDYGKDEEHEWPRAWYGVKGYFRWLESKAYKMHVRVLLSRYRSYTTCPDCQGARFQPEALLYRFTIGNSRLASRPANGRDESIEDDAIVKQESKITLADFYRLPIRDAADFVDELAGRRQFKSTDPIGLVLGEVRSRLGFLNEVGLGYLTLDRPTRTLSGGETERVNLTTCLGTRLVNTLFVLDEPSVGLHPRDTGRLVRILQQLRDAGNTVVVVEHEAGVMRAANHIIDLGPGHGATGGHIVFQGSYSAILKSEDSLTGQYLSGRKHVEIPERRPINAEQPSRLPRLGGDRRGFDKMVLNDASITLGNRDVCPVLKLSGVSLHNLVDLTVEVPLGRFVCITGVSGSGKTTLVRGALLPALEAELNSQNGNGKTAKASDRLSSNLTGTDEGTTDTTENGQTQSPIANRQSPILEGHEHLGRVVLVDQSILGKTPRSNPAVYIGAFDDLRELFARSEPAKRRGLNASAFSFNSAQGQCERCRGAGFEKIEMQFLSDVFIRCPDCDGRRYRAHILEVKVSGARCQVSGKGKARAADLTPGTPHLTPNWSIADLLEATVDEAIDFLGGFPDSRPAQQGLESLRLLQEVGLGYVRLGQPINTLSGGESQRLKLVRHLAEAVVDKPKAESRKPKEIRRSKSEKPGDASDFGLLPDLGIRTSDFKPTLFLFDEPTTGLHFDDVRVLLKVFQRLVDAGHSVWVIEHNLDVIKCADWVIDLGPEAGDKGGQIVAQGTPEQIAGCARSHTGNALRTVLQTETQNA